VRRLAAGTSNSDVQELAEGWVKTPYGFTLTDGTLIQIGFDSRSPYEIQARNGGYWLLRDGAPLEQISFQQRPHWYDQRTSDGTLMSNVIQLMGYDVLVGCILRHCEYFNDGESCKYCSLVAGTRGLRDVGIEREMGIKIPRIVETYRTALQESVRILILTGGSLRDDSREAAMYARIFAALKDVRDQAGAQTMFLGGTLAFDREGSLALRQAGVSSVTYNLEVWEPRLFAQIVPGKARWVGRDEWLQRLVDAVSVFGRGHVASNFVLGPELVADGGFRDPDQAVESWCEGFSWCIAHDVVPMITIWKPKAGSVYANQQTPPTEYFLRVARERRRLIKQSGLWSECIDIWK
ncbi:MAG: radical SAM protein, partial [Candidatus Binatia bacterium]